MKKLKLFAVALMAAFSMGAMAEDVTFTMASIFDGNTQSAVVTEPVNATVTTTATKTNAKDGKLGSDGHYFQIVLAEATFSAVSINGYINTNDTEKNWSFQFSTDGGETWSEEVSQANDGTKSAHDIDVNAPVPSGANGFRVIRRAGTTAYVSSITLSLGAATPVVTYTVTYKANQDGVEDVVDNAARKVGANMFEAEEGKMFAGWNTAADGTGIAYEVGAALTADVTLYAQWTDIVACAEIIPATAGEALNVGDEVELDVYSEGGKIFVAGMKTAGSSIAYTSYGLQLGGGGADSIRVELNNYLQVGSIIQLKLLAGGTSERGLNLLTTAKKSVFAAKWTPKANGEEKIFTYVVTANDGLAGANKFLLQRNNSVYLASVMVAACGAAVPGIEVDNTPLLKVSKEEINLNVTAENATPSVTVLFSGKNLTSGTYNLTVPTLAGLTVNPTSVTVGEDGKLNASVTFAYVSEQDVAAGQAVVGLTIGALSKQVTINYSAVHAKAYMTSVNFEQEILDNGKNINRDMLLSAANIAFVNIDALDSLNDEKTNRNYPFLGLKLKKTDAKLAGWVAQGSTIKVRFGNVGADFKVAANGQEQTLTADDYANATVDDANELVFTATNADVYVEVICGSTNTLVVKQIMINEDIKTVVLPESPQGPVALDNVEAAEHAVKFVEDGQIYILKNGVRYNALGAVVK